MYIDELKKHTSKLIQKTKNILTKTSPSDADVYGVFSQTMEFLRVYGGPKNAFLRNLEILMTPAGLSIYELSVIESIMTSFLENLEEGLHSGISPERQDQINTVSDFLVMADQLLNSRSVHPAASAVLIGASLEEFLKTWMDAEGLDLGSKRMGLQNYAQVLKEGGFSNTQDVKDITSWAGIRNEAAHGEWEKISKDRVSIMLQGVNLFMREYSPYRKQ